MEKVLKTKEDVEFFQSMCYELSELTMTNLPDLMAKIQVRAVAMCKNDPGSAPETAQTFGDVSQILIRLQKYGDTLLGYAKKLEKPVLSLEQACG